MWVNAALTGGWPAENAPSSLQPVTGEDEGGWSVVVALQNPS